MLKRERDGSHSIETIDDINKSKMFAMFLKVFKASGANLNAPD